MKELTIEQKAKAYDEALERARKELQVCGSSDCDASRQIFRFFPELKEGKDEKIRKALIDYFDDANKADENPLQNYGIHTDKVIAWLEKQDDNQNWKPSKEQISALEHFFRSIAESGYASPYDNNTKLLKSLINDLYKLKEQGKQKPQGKSAVEAAKEEKVDNQNCVNPTDKVEPKFKVGDWVVLTAGELSTTLQIVNVDTNKKLYWFNDSSYLPVVDEECLQLWTIEDAKNGDVLATENFIFIFNNIDNGNGVHYYCHYEIRKHEDDNQFGVALPQSLMGRVGNSISHYFPATKEQRDTLEKAMRDAGYIFDFEKKELKKIGNEIEIPFGAKDSELQEVTYYIPKGFHAEIDDDKVVIKKGEKPAKWSEEDESMLECALDMVKWFIGRNETKCRSVSNWLKSLKQRIGG